MSEYIKVFVEGGGHPTPLHSVRRFKEGQDPIFQLNNIKFNLYAIYMLFFYLGHFWRFAALKLPKSDHGPKFEKNQHSFYFICIVRHSF